MYDELDGSVNDSSSRKSRSPLLCGIVALLAVILTLFILYKDGVIHQEAAHDTKSEAVSRQLDAFCTASACPACSVTVRTAENDVLEYAYGFEDFGALTAASSKTIMRIASVTKPHTAALTLILAEKGLIDPQSTLLEVLENHTEVLTVFNNYTTFKANMRDMTVQDLLSHRSGIRHYATHDEYLDISNNFPRNDTRLIDVLSEFGNDPLLFPPGTGYSYSAFGFNVVGILLETVTGESYYDLLQKYILDPLEMRSTYGGWPVRNPPAGLKFAKQYYRACHQKNETYKLITSCDLKPAENANLFMKGSSGGLLSTASDLTRFANGLFFHNLLSPSVTQREILTGQAQLPDGSWYSSGWHISNHTNSTSAWHAGGAIGGVAYVQVDLKRRFSVGLMCNAQFGQPTASGLTKIASSWLD